jgi:hypothetical protein
VVVSNNFWGFQSKQTGFDQKWRCQL